MGYKPLIEQWFEGLRLNKQFKTGQKVQRGEVIGTAGYYYKKIKEPCICIEISKKSIAVDPMTPFGLKTTFQKPDLERKSAFTKEEAIEDYDIFIDALKEGFPGLYDYVSKAEFERFTTSKQKGFSEMVTAFGLENALCGTLGLIRDSHSTLMNPSNKNPRFCTINIGIQDDSLVVTQTGLAYTKYLGKRILTVDGIPCDSMKTLIQHYITGSDGFVESYADFEMLCQLDLRYCRFIQPEASRCDVWVDFADGETRLFKGEKIEPGKCYPIKAKLEKMVFHQPNGTHQFPDDFRHDSLFGP